MHVHRGIENWLQEGTVTGQGCFLYGGEAGQVLGNSFWADAPPYPAHTPPEAK